MKFMHRQRSNRLQHVGAAVTPDPAAPVFISPVSISGGTVEGSILTVSPGLVSGYPTPTIAYQWKAGGTNVGTNSPANTSFDTTGHVAAITCVETATNSEGSVTSTSNSITVVAADTTIDAITFTPVTGAALSTLYTSNTVTIAGVNTPSPMTITGGQYIKNGGAPSSGATTVSNGDIVAVQGTSSPSYETDITISLIVGGVTYSYVITTEANVADPVTLSPTLKNTNVALSNGNLTATTTSGASDDYSDVLSTALSDGTLLYCEFTAVQIGSPGGLSFGVATPDVALNTYPGQTTDSAGTFTGGGFWDGASSGPGPGYVNGDVMALAFKPSTKELWTKNLTAAGAWSASGDPAAGTGGWTAGLLEAGPWHFFLQLGKDAEATVNFDGPFTGTPPTGAVRWDGLPF